jgi:hypothetical protein
LRLTGGLIVFVYHLYFLQHLKQKRYICSHYQIGTGWRWIPSESYVVIISIPANIVSDTDLHHTQTNFKPIEGWYSREHHGWIWARLLHHTIWVRCFIHA